MGLYQIETDESTGIEPIFPLIFLGECYNLFHV